MRGISTVAITIVALAGARATARPGEHAATASIAGELRAAAKGQPVFLASNDDGVAAYAADGTVVRQLTADHAVGAELDERREILFVTDPTGDVLSAIDLRDPAPAPVVIARGLAGNPLWSDDGRPIGLGELRIRWSAHPAVDIHAGPCVTDEQVGTACTAAERAQRDDALRATAAKIQLDGAAWIAANAGRTLRPARTFRKFAGKRASLAPRSWEVVVGRFCEHDCIAVCEIHDRRRDRWLDPIMPDAWTRDRSDTGDQGASVCDFDFDAGVEHWFWNAHVCAPGAPCVPIDGVTEIIGWLDPGIATYAAAVEQR